MKTITVECDGSISQEKRYQLIRSGVVIYESQSILTIAIFLNSITSYLNASDYTLSYIDVSAEKNATISCST